MQKIYKKQNLSCTLFKRAELNYCIAWYAGNVENIQKNAENIQKTKPVLHPLQRAVLNYCTAWCAGNAENIQKTKPWTKVSCEECATWPWFTLLWF